MEKSPPTVILGAGLAGLAAALTLHRAGERVVVLEASSEVGGRVRTRLTSEGFVIDEGFQVLLNSYPELSRFVALEQLHLSRFNSGALIFNGEKMDLLANPMVHPDTLLTGVFHRLLTLSDKARILALIASSQLYRSDASHQGHDSCREQAPQQTPVPAAPLVRQSTGEFLEEFGFSRDFIEKFWRPFLKGVLLDPDLSINASYFKFLIRCFGLGAVSLPRDGMQALPKLMASQLPQGSVRLGQHVRNWTADHVVLANGEVLKANKVIVAFDSRPVDQQADYRQVTTTYFSSPTLAQLGWDRWLILVPATFKLRINHLALLTSISPSYGPQPLLSASVVGDPVNDPATLIPEIEQLAGRPLNLRLVDSVTVRRALPTPFENPRGFGESEGVLYCGDRWASPSINGALRSGRLAAEEVLATSAATALHLTTP